MLLSVTLVYSLLACTDSDRRPRGDDDDDDTAPTSSHTGDSTPHTGIDPDGVALQFHGEHPRNLLMLSIDTTRRDFIAPYTPDGAVYTPFLTEWMAQGVRLDEHQQCSNWTYNSTSCTLQGRYHEEQGYIPPFEALLTAQLPDGQQSFALRLGQQGYTSVLVSSNTWMSATVNNAQGYDEAGRVFTGQATGLAVEGMNRLKARLAVKERPWLLHVHFIEPHPPYTPPEEFRSEENELPPLPEGFDLDTQMGQYDAGDQWPAMTPEEQDLLKAHLLARYRGELRYLDAQLRDIVAMFDQNGLLDDTLVLVWTDHGEQFWDHGKQAHAYYLGAEENDGVAFFWAKNIKARAWTEPTHAVDLLPTTLDALGFPVDPEDPTFSGEVIGTAPADRPLYAMTVARLGTLEAVTLDGWKLVFDFDGTVDLYDRNTDRYEAVDLYTPDHPQVGPLWDLLLPRIVTVSELTGRAVVWPEGLPQPSASTGTSGSREGGSSPSERASAAASGSAHASAGGQAPAGR